MLPANLSIPNVSNTNQMPQEHHVHQSQYQLSGQKRIYDDQLQESNQDEDIGEKGGPKKKGRKKSFIWTHVITDEQGKVFCRHCGLQVRVNYGEKVKQYLS
jgi:hypothetical protein